MSDDDLEKLIEISALLSNKRVSEQEVGINSNDLYRLIKKAYSYKLDNAIGTISNGIKKWDKLYSGIDDINEDLNEYTKVLWVFHQNNEEVDEFKSGYLKKIARMYFDCLSMQDNNTDISHWLVSMIGILREKDWGLEDLNIWIHEYEKAYDKVNLLLKLGIKINTWFYDVDQDLF